MTGSCGDRKTDAGRRKSLGAEVRKYEDFRQKTVQRFDEMYSVKASNHTAGRNQAVAQLLSCLSLMRSLGDIDRSQPLFTWSKAQLFAVTGSTDDNAAHCLPCQLWIDNKKPWELVRSPLVNRDRMIEMLRVEIFGHETILPLAFNLADCLSEDNCLRGALVFACEYVVAHTIPKQRKGGVLKHGAGGLILLTVQDRPQATTAGVDHQAVMEAYRVWQEQARRAYQAAAEEAKGGVERAGKDYTNDVLYILDRYLRSLAEVPPRACDAWMWKFENDLWV